MNEIATVLSSAIEHGSGNALTLENVKHWLGEYLQLRKEEAERFPKEKNRAHWDLLAADCDRDRDAMFLLAFFQGDTVVFLGGRGRISVVRDFAQNTFPNNPKDVLEEVSRRFWIGERVAIELDDVVRWLSS